MIVAIGGALGSAFRYFFGTNCFGKCGSQCYIGFHPGLAGLPGRILDLEMTMQLPQEGTLLRIFIGEADKVQGKPLFEWIVLQAQRFYAV